MIRQVRTRQGEAHTANDGVFRAALDSYTLLSLSNVPRGHVLLALMTIYPHVKFLILATHVITRMVPLHAQTIIVYVLRTIYMPHYPHLSRWTEILTDCGHARHHHHRRQYLHKPHYRAYLLKDIMLWAQLLTSRLELGTYLPIQ